MASARLVRKLFVHVGPPKTGTTTIQSILSAHDNSIVIYPKVGLAGPGAHHNLVWNFRGKGGQQQFVKQQFPEMLKQISRCAQASNRNILISSETLLPVGGNGRKLGEQLESFITALLPSMGDNALETEILVSCREHFARAASYYSELVKLRLERALKLEPDEYLSRFASRLCYSQKMTELRKSGFKVVLLNYHPGRTWVSRFLAHVGFAEHQIPSYGSRHVSLSRTALIAKLAANLVLDSDRELQLFLRQLGKHIPLHSPSEFIFGPEAANRAEQLFEVDRNFILREFGIALERPSCGRENMFYLDDDSLAQIAAAAGILPAKAHAIVASARRFLRVRVGH